MRNNFFYINIFILSTVCSVIIPDQKITTETVFDGSCRRLQPIGTTAVYTCRYSDTQSILRIRMGLGEIQDSNLEKCWESSFYSVETQEPLYDTHVTDLWKQLIKTSSWISKFHLPTSVNLLEGNLSISTLPCWMTQCT